jgi:GNAT superfamily N-acetyltransferase
MTEHHPYQLYAVEFQETDQARLADFSCGAESWSKCATEWIRGSDALNSMTKWGTRVWLFETEGGDLVGFGSLGASRWRWPPPDGPHASVALIPMLGIDVRFHGQPDDPEWRYSRQIMSHLIAEAERTASEWRGKPSERPEWLVLQVHRDNSRAIRLYQNCGFELIPGVERAHDHRVMKLAIGE